jgi:hypothetical protein
MARQEAWLQVIGEAANDSRSSCAVEVCHVEERKWLEDRKQKTKKKKNKKNTKNKKKQKI